MSLRLERMFRKSDNENNETPIYAFTADITADINKEYEDYFTGFLHKPIEIDKFYDVLNKIKGAVEKSIGRNKEMRLAS